MRIGSLVSKESFDEESNPYLEPDALVGTIIGIEHGDRDGYEVMAVVTIRWPDGKIETLRREDEDSDYNTLVDVTPECYANLYLQDRAYGGPEEGGWWYDVRTPADGDWDTEPPQHGHFPTPDEALAAAEQLQEWCERENFNRRPPSSVLSEGHFVVRVEAWPAEPSPKNRPHYC